jgi:hypothetical protein
MLKRWMMLFLAVFVGAFAQAGAEEIAIEEVRTQMGESAVVYPQLKGKYLGALCDTADGAVLQ